MCVCACVRARCPCIVIGRRFADGRYDESLKRISRITGANGVLRVRESLVSSSSSSRAPSRRTSRRERIAGKLQRDDIVQRRRAGDDVARCKPNKMAARSEAFGGTVVYSLGKRSESRRGARRAYRFLATARVINSR